jgi:hypothetical protein
MAIPSKAESLSSAMIRRLSRARFVPWKFPFQPHSDRNRDQTKFRPECSTDRAILSRRISRSALLALS